MRSIPRLTWYIASVEWSIRVLKRVMLAGWLACMLNRNEGCGYVASQLPDNQISRRLSSPRRRRPITRMMMRRPRRRSAAILLPPIDRRRAPFRAPQPEDFQEHAEEGKDAVFVSGGSGAGMQ